jgi:hypothetical protein
LDVLKKLETTTFPGPPSPPTSDTTSLFNKITFHIKRGDIKEQEFKDPKVWQASICNALHVFSTSVRSAIASYLKVTPTFGAFYRGFLRDFEPIIIFLIVSKTASREDWTEFNTFIAKGGIMKPGDPMFRARERDLEVYRNDGVLPAFSKRQKNAKKKAKKALKKGEIGSDIVSVVAQENSGVLDLD